MHKICTKLSFKEEGGKMMGEGGGNGDFDFFWCIPWIYTKNTYVYLVYAWYLCKT